MKNKAQLFQQKLKDKIISNSLLKIVIGVIKINNIGKMSYLSPEEYIFFATT